MNFNSSNKGSVTSAAYELNEELGKISLRSASAFEYSEGDDVLYVTQQEIVSENFCYNGQDAPPIDSGGSPCSGALSGTWEYASPDSKFADCVVAELGREEVRWFYKSDSNKRWIEFSGYDSLRIESKYRDLHNESPHFKTSCSDRENAEETYFEEIAAIDQSALPLESSNFVSSSYDCDGPGAAHTSDSEQHRIVVRGGMYEVDLNTYKCDSIYWPGRGIYLHACYSLFCLRVLLVCNIF
jgi:hypothetical protein